MRVRIAVVMAALVVAGSCSHGNSAPVSRRPNVLVIVTDDQRSDEMDVMTQTLRRFGREGTTLSQAFDSTPLCCPSRATIMTGQYAHSHGVLSNTLPFVEKLNTQHTVQHYLHESGYQTALVGKYFNDWPITGVPPDFDNYAAYGSPPGSNTLELSVNGNVEAPTSFAAETLQNEAMRALTRFERDDADPWFLYLAPLSPHWPYPVADRDTNADVGPFKPGIAAGETNLSDKPPELRHGLDIIGDAASGIWTQQRRSLLSADRLIGAVFDKLKALGESDTLAFFISDNGYMLGEHGIVEDKRVPYTESVHVPMMIRWPKHVRGGKVDARLALNADIMPTILDATGVAPAADSEPDGRSLLKPSTRTDVLLEFFESKEPPAPGVVPSWASVRSSAFQYIEWYTPTGTMTWRELYDLRKDPAQMTSLVPGDPAKPLTDPNARAFSDRLSHLRFCRGTRPNPYSCP